MASEFSKQKARSRLKGTTKSTTMYVEIPGGSHRTIASPGIVSLNKIEVHPTDDCVLELRYLDTTTAVYLAGGNLWGYHSSEILGSVSLTIRNKTSMSITAKIDLNWTIL